MEIVKVSGLTGRNIMVISVDNMENYKHLQQNGQNYKAFEHFREVNRYERMNTTSGSRWF